MPRHRFTLAALATLAVPGLDVAVTRTFTGGGDGLHDAALLTDRTGADLVVRAPVDDDAAARLDAEVGGLGALTAGVRGRLPFEVPAVVGVLAAPRAVVSTYVAGARLRPAAVTAERPLVRSVARAMAAVHDLPTLPVTEAGRPEATAAACADGVRRLLARADSTGEVPLELVNRWSAAADDPALWRFRPTVVHGTLAPECLLTASPGTAEERVTGVLGWSGLAVGDPAQDLAWCLGLPAPGAAAAVLTAYGAARPRDADPGLTQRALLYAELELVRWLLHGLEARDDAVVGDAVHLLEALLAGVLEHTAGVLGDGPPRALTVAEVERMLDARAHREAPRLSTSADSRAPVAAQAARSSSTEATRSGRTTRSRAT